MALIIPVGLTASSTSTTGLASSTPMNGGGTSLTTQNSHDITTTYSASLSGRFGLLSSFCFVFRKFVEAKNIINTLLLFSSDSFSPSIPISCPKPEIRELSEDDEPSFTSSINAGRRHPHPQALMDGGVYMPPASTGNSSAFAATPTAFSKSAFHFVSDYNSHNNNSNTPTKLNLERKNELLYATTPPFPNNFDYKRSLSVSEFRIKKHKE